VPVEAHAVPLIAPTMPLVVGGGGREHALAWKLAAEPGVNQVTVAPGSDAIAAVAGVRRFQDVDPLDPSAVVAAARRCTADLVIVGPEAPLAAGVADALADAGIPCFGPTEVAARIETSKAFCHEVAAAAGVRMAAARAFAHGEAHAARVWAEELDRSGRGIVLKADGLAAGKGVVVCHDLADAVERIPGSLDGPAGSGPALVIEERLEGPEASVIAICDGRRAIALPTARDHKRLGDGDAGPNTGGMGAYSPLPDLTDAEVAEILETVHLPLLEELARRGTPFRGFLYAGLMLTAQGPALLECNARLGDPEAQIVLPRLATALGPWLLAAARGALPDATDPWLPVRRTAAVGIVLAAAGYPGTPVRDDAIDGLDAAAASGALLFHAGTRVRPDGTWATDGGRVLTVVGQGPDLAEARAAAERAADLVRWPGLQRRHDIAAPAGASVGAPR